MVELFNFVTKSVKQKLLICFSEIASLRSQ